MTTWVISMSSPLQRSLLSQHSRELTRVSTNVTHSHISQSEVTHTNSSLYSYSYDLLKACMGRVTASCCNLFIQSLSSKSTCPVTSLTGIMRAEAPTKGHLVCRENPLSQCAQVKDAKPHLFSPAVHVPHLWLSMSPSNARLPIADDKEREGGGGRGFQNKRNTDIMLCVEALQLCAASCPFSSHSQSANYHYQGKIPKYFFM